MEGRTLDWGSMIASAVLVVVAVVLIVVSAVALSRVNGYTKQFDGVDLVPAADWSNEDSPESGVSRIKGVQNYTVAVLLVSLVLAALAGFVVFKLFGAPAAGVYMIFAALAAISGFVTLYYLGSVGKNRQTSDTGASVSGALVDVAHPFMSLMNLGFAITIIHSIVAAGLGIFLIIRRRGEAPKKAEPLLGEVAGRGRQPSPTRAGGMAATSGAGASYWREVLGRQQQQYAAAGRS